MIFAANGVAGKPAGGDHASTIAAVRAYAINYAGRMPKSTCTLITRETTRPRNAVNDPAVQLTTTEQQLTFADGQEHRRVARIDAQAIPAAEGDQPAGILQREAESILAMIFEPAAGADIRWDRTATVDGRKVDVLAFRLGQAAGYVLPGSAGRGARVPFEGFVFADVQTHAVLRVQMKCTGIPDDSDIRTLQMNVEYKRAVLSGQEFVLPAHFTIQFLNDRDDRSHDSDGKYSAWQPL